MKLWPTRRTFPVVLAVLALAAGPLPTPSAQVPAGDRQEPIRIAVVVSRPDGPYEDLLGGFRELLREQKIGVALEMYLLPEAEEDGPPLANQIRSWQPRLILALGSPALQRVGQDFPNVPTVFGLILSEAIPNPQGQTTGVVLDFPIQTQFEWLHRVLPEARTIGVVFNPEENAVRIQSAQVAASALGLKLDARAISSPQELPAALNALANTADVLWGLNDRMVMTPQTARSLLLFSFRNRIPFVGLSAAWVKAGALFALERDYRDIGRQCGEIARQLLQGGRPAELAPAHPRKVLLSVNRRTAEQMKIELNESLLKDAGTIY